VAAAHTRASLTLADWKSPRIGGHIATRFALSTPSERLRIESLTLLHGVAYPMASVILHFCHRDPYPILDVRALWSLGTEEPSSGYTFDFWLRYTTTCRDFAAAAGCDLRTLDRALWGYSKARG